MSNNQDNGNTAAMREAIAEISKIADDWSLYSNTKAGALDRIYELANAALSVPQRNCDRFNTSDPMKDAEDAYDTWQRHCDDPTIPPSYKANSAFKYWLFAPAKRF